VTDSQGRLVSFKNCLIIMTSNLGSAEIFEALSAAPDSEARRVLVKEKVGGQLVGAVRGCCCCC
jgi:ATP-dependent Clp protease ATP-binding subunit ClpB